MEVVKDSQLFDGWHKGAQLISSFEVESRLIVPIVAIYSLCVGDMVSSPYTTNSNRTHTK